MTNTALEKKWAEEEENKTPLEKAYDEGTTLNPEKQKTHIGAAS